MKRRIIFFITFSAICFNFTLFGQNQVSPDEKVYQEIDAWLKKAWKMANTNPDSSRILANKAFSISTTLKYKKGLGGYYAVNGLLFLYQVNYDKAIESLLESLEYFRSEGDKLGEAKSLNLLGVIYADLGFYKKALDINYKCLAIRIEANDSVGISGSYNNIAVDLHKLGKPKEALEYYRKALVISNSINNFNSTAFYFKNIASLYFQLGKKDSGLYYIFKSKEIYDEQNDFQGISNVSEILGKHYLETGQYQKAIDILERGLQFAKKTEIIYEIESNSKYLYQAYEKIGKKDKAYETLLLYKQMSDSSKATEGKNRIVRMEVSALYEKEKEIERLKNEHREKEAKQELENSQTTRNFFVLLAALVFLILILVYISYRRKKRDNVILQQQKKAIEEYSEEIKSQKEELSEKKDLLETLNTELIEANEELKQQKEEILSQRDELEISRDLIEQKNRNITDSIRYARHIQNAVLTDEKTFKHFFPQSFIFYRPKDIVSGDFFWLTEKDHNILFSAIDCTGHGVPGAFMSIVAHNLLSRAVKQHNIVKPAAILHFLSNEVYRSLRRNGNESGIKDGMDMVLCNYNQETGELLFSGINNPLFHWRKGFLKEYKTEKYPIGELLPENTNYCDQIILIEPGDIIYIFSDGYVDQYGGTKRKKFLVSRFRTLITEVALLPIEIQRTELSRRFDEWKGSFEQLDDVIVIGVQF